MSFSVTTKRFICLSAALIMIFTLTSAVSAEITDTPSNVTVSYSTGGGKPVPPKETLEKGFHLSATPTVNRAGYSFAGWYKDAKFAEPFSITASINENTRLYAKWTKNPVVSFSAKGGKPAPAKQSVLPDERAQIPEEPTRTGYVFQGWYKDSRLTQEFDFETPIVTNTTLYAKWAALPTVSFSCGGGKPLIPKQTVDLGGNATEPQTLTKIGYTFDGWYTNSRFTTKYNFSTAVNTRITLYAKWIRNPKVKFSTKGKCPAPEPQDLLPGELADEPELSIPAGYIFEGWYKDSSCRFEFNFQEPVTSSLTVYANITRDPTVPMVSTKTKK